MTLPGELEAYCVVDLRGLPPRHQDHLFRKVDRYRGMQLLSSFDLAARVQVRGVELVIAMNTPF